MNDSVEIITTRNDEIIKFKRENNTYSYYNKDYHRQYYLLHKNDDKECNYCNVIYKAGLKHNCEKKKLAKIEKEKQIVIKETDTQDIVEEKQELKKEKNVDKNLSKELYKLKKKEQFDCEICGGYYTHSNRSFHKKTLKHLNALHEFDANEIIELRKKIVELENGGTNLTL